MIPKGLQSRSCLKSTAYHFLPKDRSRVASIFEAMRNWETDSVRSWEGGASWKVCSFRIHINRSMNTCCVLVISQEYDTRDSELCCTSWSNARLDWVAFVNQTDTRKLLNRNKDSIHELTCYVVRPHTFFDQEYAASFISIAYTSEWRTQNVLNIYSAWKRHKWRRAEKYPTRVQHTSCGFLQQHCRKAVIC